MTLHERHQHRFRSTIGAAILAYAAVGDGDTPEIAHFMISNLLLAAWTCAREFGFTAEQFSQAALVEAHRPIETGRPN